MTTLKELVRQHPVLRAWVRTLRGFIPGTQSSSSPKPLLGPDAENTALLLRNSWQHTSIPALQRALVEHEISDYRRGMPNLMFDELAYAVREASHSGAPSTLLEVGCSSGHYSEVLRLKGANIVYAGCDFSESFIELARTCYPGLRFDVEDATALGYADSSFDIVVSGCCILHIPDYAKAIAETARVARRTAIFHRTPVLHMQATRVFTKKAYGVETIELHFNETELVRLFALNNLHVKDIVTLNVDWRSGDANAVKTYVCEKTVA